MSQSNHEVSLRERIKKYKKRMTDIESHLKNKPNDWGRFQSEFNQEISGIFRELMVFEKDNLAMGNENKVYRLKQFFKENFQQEFVKGHYIKWSLEKPYGYAGDFQIINDIYLNCPVTTGVARLFDNFFLSSPASQATRNRKEDFKRIIREFILKRKGKEVVRIMDLASGPSRDIYEFLFEFGQNFKNVKFYCYENDEKAIEFSKKLIGNLGQVEYVKENVVKMALRKNIENAVNDRFDLIFSTGLFDYLEHRVGVRLVSNLKKLLVSDGEMVISNYRDKYSNPSIHFMEWVGEWNLVYRTEEEFSNMFIESGFNPQKISFDYEQQGIMQYCFAENNDL